jgi:hypothetical protein
LSCGKIDHLAKFKNFGEYLNHPNIYLVRQREMFTENQIQLLLEFVVDLCETKFDISWRRIPKKIDRMDSCINMIVDKFVKNACF